MPVRQRSLNAILTIFDAVCILILGGCGSLMDREETVIVQFPSFPYPWMEREDPDFYELVYIDEGNERRISTVPGQRQVAIRLSLGRTTPLLGYPVLYRRRFFLPLNSGRLCASILPAGCIRMRYKRELYPLAGRTVLQQRFSSMLEKQGSRSILLTVHDFLKRQAAGVPPTPGTWIPQKCWEHWLKAVFGPIAYGTKAIHPFPS